MSHQDGQRGLIPASAGPPRASEDDAGGGPSPTTIAEQLRHRTEQGFTSAAAAVSSLLGPESALPVGGDPSRILVAESDPSLGDLMEAILREQGYAVTGAKALDSAVALLIRQSFDLVVTDGFSRMPSEVLPNVAELRETAGATPVVLCTGHKLDLDAVLRAGFRDLIAKPFDLDDFEHRIQATLQRDVPRPCLLTPEP
jgi:CheY-like chemotaxis protein